MIAELLKFGNIYQSNGRGYLLLGRTGIRTESCKYFEGALRSFSPAQVDSPAWWVANVEGLDRPLRIHNNRVSEPDFGTLLPGTKIEGVLDLQNSPEDYCLAWAVRRVLSDDLTAGANL